MEQEVTLTRAGLKTAACCRHRQYRVFDSPLQEELS
jgi:hypothetical protein